MTWELAAAMNAAIAACYLAICATILGGLIRTHQLRSNPLGAATAAIFLTCAVHHGAHTVHMVLPSFGVDHVHGVAFRQAFGWQAAVWDAIGAAVAVYYLSLRRTYGVLLRTPAMFDDEVQRRAGERLERQRAMLTQAEELAGAGSWETDLVSGRVTWSVGMYRMRCLEPRDETLTVAASRADVHPEDRARVQAERAAALAGDSRQASFRYRIVVADEAVRHLEGHVHIERDEDGAPVRMVGVTLDVTERRETEIARDRAERVLREREQMLSGVIENNPALIYVKDLDGRYVLYNEPFARAFDLEGRGEPEGLPARSVLLGRTDEWLDPALAPVWRESDLRARLGANRVEEHSEHPGRGRLSYDSVKFPLLDADGRLAGTCGVSLETTENKLLQAELQRSSRYFELSRDLVCTASVDGYFKQLNDAWTRTLGWSAEELCSRPFAHFVHPDDRAATEDELARVAASDSELGQTFVNRYATKQGDWRWLEWHAMITPEHGLIYASARDITERKRDEDRIAHSEKLLADLLNSAPDAVVIASRDGRITLINEQTEKLFGYERDELLGSQIQGLLPDRLRGRGVGHRLDEVAEGGWRLTGLGSDLAGRRRDGSELAIDVGLSAVESEDGPLLIAFVRDVTERRRTTDELAAAHERALEASRLKSEFVANMSHELRTPLHGVIGMSGLLLDTALDDEQREYAVAIGVSADALMAVISDILDFSKIEAGKLELDRHRFDLRELVDDASSMLAAAAREQELELLVWVDGDLPRWVDGDAARIRQVLANLVTNAVKFTNAGEVLVRVTCVRRAAGALELRFSVSDTGIGIPPAALERIFDAFSQADSSTTRRYGGTGLGLAISVQLVELMGGTIGVDSEPGDGSTFWFTVPAMGVELEPAARGARGFAGTRVLGVYDNVTARAILEHQLGAWEMACDTAGGADEALRRLLDAERDGRPYDLAIVDGDLTGAGAVALVTRIRAVAALAPLRLLMLTSSHAERDAAVRAGVGGFVAKPVRESRLVDEVARILYGEHPAKPSARLQVRPPAAAPRAARGRGGSVLVAEDNAVNQLVVTRMLEKRGFRVDVAPNGRTAVEMHDRRSYELIFMDCQMPELDGYEATAAIRRRETAPCHTPIIAMTANTLKGDRERCLDAGMDDYVGKPLRPGELDEVLSRALGSAGADADAGADEELPGPEHAAPAAHEDGQGLSAEPLMDPSRLDDAFGDDAQGRATLLALFVDRSRLAVAELAAAIGARDSAAGARLAHGLKGSAAVVGAARLSALSGTSCEALAAGRLDEAGALQSELERTFELTATSLTGSADG